MAGPRSNVAPANTLLVMLSVAGLAGCRFDSTGLGQSGEGGQSGAGSTGQGTMGGQDATGGAGSTGGAGGAGSTGSTGGASQASASGESGGLTGESGDSSGEVDPGTGSTTGGTTGASTTGPSTTTGADTTTAAESSSGGCAEMAFFLDMDGDGFGDPDKLVMACAPSPDGHVDNDDDCDDSNGATNPDGDEICDGGDNDCDQLTDEWNPPMNIECGGCKMALYDDRVYHFCTTVERWDDAVKGCEARGVALAEDTDMQEHDWLVNQLPGDSSAWYIGAESPNKDDKFVWLGGSAVPDPDLRWGPTRPAGSGTTHFLSLVSNGNLNFWASYNGKWYDRAENEKEPYICEGPLPP